MTTVPIGAVPTNHTGVGTMGGSTRTIVTRTVRRVLGSRPAADQDARELELRLAPYAVTETTIRVPHQRGAA